MPLLPEHLAQALRIAGVGRWHSALAGRPHFENGGDSDRGYCGSDNSSSDSSSNYGGGSTYGGYSGYGGFGYGGLGGGFTSSSSSGSGWNDSSPAGSSTGGYGGLGGYTSAQSVGGSYGGGSAGSSYSSSAVSSGGNQNSGFSSLGSIFSGGSNSAGNGNSGSTGSSGNPFSGGSNNFGFNGTASSGSNSSSNSTNGIQSALSIASSLGVGSPFASSSSNSGGFGDFNGYGGFNSGFSTPSTTSLLSAAPIAMTPAQTMPSFYNSGTGWADYNAPQNSIDNAMRLAAGLGTSAFTKGPTSFGTPGVSGPGTDQATDTGFGSFGNAFKPITAHAESLGDTTSDSRTANLAGLLTGMSPSYGLPGMASLEGIAPAAYTRPSTATGLGPIALGSDRDSTLAHLGLYDNTPAQAGPVGSEIAPDNGYVFSPGVHILEGSPDAYGEAPAVTAKPLQGSVDPLKAALAATWSPFSGTTLAGDGRLYGDASVGRAVPTSPVRQSLAESNQGSYTDATKFSPPAASYTLGNSYPALAFAGSTGATGLYGDKSATGTVSADSSTTGDPAAVDGTRALTVHGLDATPTGFSDTAQ